MAARKLHLAPGLSMPLDAITRTFGIFGQRGTGKSTTGAVLVEQGVNAGGRSVIFDPTGVWWGLTREGSSPGLPGVVLGGEHADAPLESHAGAIVADFVIRSDYPVVVLDMKLLRKHQRVHFAMEFLETLYHDNRDPLLVVLDEAQQFAPQMARPVGQDQDVMRLIGAVEDLVALGRSRGLGAALISQRMATVNANPREQIETAIWHRLVGKLDRTALKGWIEANGDPAREKEVLDTIAKLKTGRALAWSPAFLEFFGVVDINNATTFDSRATPKVGQRVKKPGKRAPVDLDTLRVQMAETLAEYEANDPKKLQVQLREMETKLAAALRAAKQRDDLEDALREANRQLAIAEGKPGERVEVPVLATKDIDTLRGSINDLLNGIDRLTEFKSEIGDAVEPIRTGLATFAQAALDIADQRKLPVAQHARCPVCKQAVELTPSGQISAHKSTAAQGRYGCAGSYMNPGAKPPADRPKPKKADPSLNGDLSAREQRVLDAIAYYNAIGIERPSKQQVGMVAGYRVKKIGGTFGNLLGALRSRELVAYPDTGSVVLTGEGERYAQPPELGVTNEEIQATLMERLSERETRVLSNLIEVWPEALDKVELGARSGYQVTKVGGTYGNLLGALRSLGLIEYPSQGTAKAKDFLFPEGQV